MRWRSDGGRGAAATAISGRIRGTAVAREGGEEVVQAEGDLEAHLLEPEGKPAHAHEKPPPNVG